MASEWQLVSTDSPRVDPLIFIYHPPGKGDSHIKRVGVIVRNFEKNPEEVPRSYLWVWLENV